MLTELERRMLEKLVGVALSMAQELQEFVDDAVESSGDDSALAATQALLRDWDAAYSESAQLVSMAGND